MKKQIIFSLSLIASLALKAETNQEINVNSEVAPAVNNAQQLQAQDTKTRKEIIFDIEKISEIIEKNLPEVSEKCDSVTLTFKIDKDVVGYNKEVWQKVVLMASTLIKDCNLNVSNDQNENVNKTLNESHKFLVETSKLTGSENKVYGSYGVYLNIPADYANQVFAPAAVEK